MLQNENKQAGLGNIVCFTFTRKGAQKRENMKRTTREYAVSHNEIENLVMAHQLNGNTFLLRHELGGFVGSTGTLTGSERHPPQMTAKHKTLQDEVLMPLSDHFFSAP